MINILNILSAMYCLTAILTGCDSASPSIANKAQQKQSEVQSYKGLRGTWAKYGKYGFTLIEILDSTHVTYHQVADQRELVDTISHNRYWYYKSAAKMGYWGKDSTSIWIRTDRFRFDYRVEKNGNLQEYDKMGSQGVFVKMPKPRD